MLEILEPLGKEFDPKFSEAVGVIDTKIPMKMILCSQFFRKDTNCTTVLSVQQKVRVGKYVP